MKFTGFAVILGSILLADGALAQGCTTTTIRTAKEAEAIAQKCPIFHGNLTIESSADTPRLFNLTGIEVIEGTFMTDCGKMQAPGSPPGFGPCMGMFGGNSTKDVDTTVEALTLRTVTGGVNLSSFFSLSNFTAPNLETIGSSFYVSGTSLEYLDLSSLTAVGKWSMTNSGIRELKHGGLKKITGGRSGRKEISMYGLPNLKNVDSILASPVELDKVEFEQGTMDMDSITIGTAKAAQVSIKGMGNLKVTLGTKDTESMDIAKLKMRGVKEVARDDGAKDIKVGIFDVQKNGFVRLDIEFDDLGELYMMYESNLEVLTFPPMAKDYTNLTVAIWDCEKLELLSEYIRDEDGQRVRGWYWPEGDMGRIAIYNVHVDEALFESLIESRMKIEDPEKRPKIKSIDLWPPAKNKDSLDCSRLKQLEVVGAIEEDVVCDGFSEPSGAAGLRSRGWWAAAAGMAVTAWMAFR